MPHIRKDPITKRWIITSTSRGAKPSDYVSAPEATQSGSKNICPFCVGHEDKTVSDILSTKDDTGKWRVRIVPNKYPVLSEVSSDVLPENSILYEAHPASGYHDVVIEHPSHDFNLYKANTEDMKYIFDIVIKRLLDLSKKTNMEYSLYFKNFGSEAGASLSHSHSQIITTPFIPIQMMEDIHGSFDYYHTHKGCIYCAIIREELKSKERIITENDAFIAFTPFASRSPYQICIIQKEHKDSALFLSDNEIYLFASIVQNVFSRINKVLGMLPFNYILYSLPSHLRASYSSSSHWHFEILPKLSKLAGFEIGSGVYINSVLPEYAAEALRT